MRKLPDSLSPTAAFLARHSAIVALAVFAIVGVAFIEDYGVGIDEDFQRTIGYASFNYILSGDEDALFHEDDHHRYYGVAFELPLIAVERLLRLEDSRDIFLSRRLITHLFFLAGGFFAWLLTYRLFGSRLIALIVMLIFLLHPRIYAHSFFNSKDIPFVSMFIIALYLIHRAFRRDTAWAFALCGVGVGLLANIRITGVMLIPAVLGMLALDALYAMRRGEGVKHALAGICAFSATCVATLYAASPALWRDPLGIAEALAMLSSFPLHNATLFRGELVQWPNLPWDYIPTWILITTPPVALALAAIGIGYAARLCAADWRVALGNSTARFGLLAAACLILPVAAFIALNSNAFNGWRQAYFLYAPICVLAAFGLRGLAALPKPRLRAAAFALAALGLAVVTVQMIRLHPLQNLYFSPLVDKSALADRWEMDYWSVSYKEALDALLKTQPEGRVPVSANRWVLNNNARLIAATDRRRLSVNPSFPSFRIVHGDGGDSAYPLIWTREVYGVPVVSIADVRAETEAVFRAAYAAAKKSERIASAGGFDIYRSGESLIYIKEAGGEEDARGRIDLNIAPLRSGEDGAARESRRFHLRSAAALFDGKVLIAAALPNYPILAIETSLRLGGEDAAQWSADVDFYAAALSKPPSGLAASAGGFDLYADGGTLTYVKRQCAEGDTRGRFFLSIFPADPSDLSQYARDAGREHEALNFDFARYGAIVDGGCAIIRNLPDYAIKRIETGQWLSGEGELWSVRIVVSD